jgi:hypothetical protein
LILLNTHKDFYPRHSPKTILQRLPHSRAGGTRKKYSNYYIYEYTSRYIIEKHFLYKWKYETTKQF